MFTQDKKSIWEWEDFMTACKTLGDDVTLLDAVRYTTGTVKDKVLLLKKYKGQESDVKALFRDEFERYEREDGEHAIPVIHAVVVSTDEVIS